VLVIQNDVGNHHSRTTIVAAITSTIKRFPFTVVLESGEAGLLKPSMVNLAQVFTVDKSRLRHRLGALSVKKMNQVDTAIRISLDVA